MNRPRMGGSTCRGRRSDVDNHSRRARQTERPLLPEWDIQREGIGDGHLNSIPRRIASIAIGVGRGALVIPGGGRICAGARAHSSTPPARVHRNVSRIQASERLALNPRLEIGGGGGPEIAIWKGRQHDARICSAYGRVAGCLAGHQRDKVVCVDGVRDLKDEEEHRQVYEGSDQGHLNERCTFFSLAPAKKSQDLPS